MRPRLLRPEACASTSRASQRAQAAAPAAYSRFCSRPQTKNMWSKARSCTRIRPGFFMWMGLMWKPGAPREAIAVVHVDGRVPPEVLDELRKVPAVEQAKAIRLF